MYAKIYATILIGSNPPGSDDALPIVVKHTWPVIYFHYDIW